MRQVVAFAWLVACGGGQSPPDGGMDDLPPLPQECVGRCIVDEPVTGPEDCCDSITCFFDRTTNAWVAVTCEPPFDPCSNCLADQICVQRFDDQCVGTTTCEPLPVGTECPASTCSPECEDIFCTAPQQCQVVTVCGTESSQSFKCYAL